MEKVALRCDLCNGSLEMQPGGQTAICEFCGTKYSIGRLREKIQEIRGTVSVEGVVKTASADFDIQAGVLLHYRGKDTEVVVPEGVHEIGESCFKGMQYLTSITFPEGLVRIANDAFSDCSGLTQIIIPQAVIAIGRNAFCGCTGLKQVTIPNSVTKIGEGSFASCTGLKQIALPNSITTIEDSTFYSCTGLKQITIPNSVTTIGNGAFSGCISLLEISFSQNLQHIGWAAFEKCTSFTEIILPQGLRMIRAKAFGNCDNLTEITIPAGASLETDALRETNIKRLTILGKKAEYNYHNFYELIHIHSLETVSPPDAEEHLVYTLLKSVPMFYDSSPWTRRNFKRFGKCQHCGSDFAGLINKKCTRCHKPKDY